jgi:hypothetical protein
MVARAESQKDLPYRVYTRDFDKIVRADELDTVLEPLSDGDRCNWDDAWNTFQAELTVLACAIASSPVRCVEAPQSRERTDIVVAILVDHSGSLKNEKLLLAAAAADIARNHRLVPEESPIPPGTGRVAPKAPGGADRSLLTHLLTTAAPALQTTSSCAPVAPEQPTAPISLPSLMSGMPPRDAMIPSIVKM